MENKKGHIKLEELGNEQPFKIPSGYFDTFEHELFSRIEELQQVKKPKGIIFYIKPLLTVAASLIIVFLVVYYPLKEIKSKTELTKKATNYTETEFMAQFMVTDREVVECMETEAKKDTIDVAIIESVLLASLSDIELMELN